jgi:glycosyltransferase involved in cell wall biosynthesis
MSKILYVTPSLNIGGAEKHVVFLASKFKKGHKVRLLSMFAEGPLINILKNNSIDVEFIAHPYIRISDKILLNNSYNYIQSFFGKKKDKVKLPNDSKVRIMIRERKIKDAIKKFKPDILHVHTLHCSDVLKWGYELGIKKRVFTHHNILSTRHHNQDIARLSKNIEYATDITFVSDFQKTDLIEVLKKDINGPVISPISGFSGNVKNLPEHFPEVVKLGTLSNLAPVKGVAYLLEAINLLYKNGINVKLYIAGDGEYRSHLQEIASSLECSHIVHFMGRLSTTEELDKFYRKIDVFVLPSFSESFGIVLVEAMSYGLPVIASDLPAVKEIISDNCNGLLFHPGDVEGLVQKIKLLAGNDALRKQIISNAIKSYSEKFHVNAIVNNYSGVYSIPL